MTGTTRPRSDAAAAPLRAADTELLGRLEADWQALVTSPRSRTQLRRWATEDPRLAFVTGDELVAAAQRRDMTDWHERDRPLEALLERFDNDPLARRVALQIVLPGLKHLIDGVRGWDTEERASRVVAEAIEVLDRCARAGAGTAPNFRVFMNTRRRVIRAAVRARSEPLSLSGDLAGYTDEPDPLVEPHDEVSQLRDLIEWVHQAGVPEQVAREMVITRTGQIAVPELATALGVKPGTLRQRRRRAEQQLTRALGIER